MQGQELGDFFRLMFAEPQVTSCNDLGLVTHQVPHDLLPPALKKHHQTGTGASHIKSFIRYLKNFEFEKPLGDHAPNQRLIYEPKGVCALITPWNWPMNQVCLKVMPAIAAGCTMVLKPSELGHVN